jgi:hypothetical protein
MSKVIDQHRKDRLVPGVAEAVIAADEDALDLGLHRGQVTESLTQGGRR